MKNLLFILILMGFWQCEEAPRDVSHCPDEPTECEQYSCYFLSCDCIAPEGEEADPYEPLFSTDQDVNSEAIAKQIGLAFMEMIGDTSVEINEVGEQGYGWYFVTFKNPQNLQYEYISISPKGNVYITACGV